MSSFVWFYLLKKHGTCLSNMTCFTNYVDLKFHSFSTYVRIPFFFMSNATFFCTHITFFHPFTLWLALRLVSYVGCCEPFLNTHSYAGIPIVYRLYFLWYIPRNSMVQSYNTYIFRFLRNFYTDFRSGCTNLHSYQQCRKDPVFLWILASIYCFVNSSW